MKALLSLNESNNNMETKTYSLVRQWDDHEPVLLGKVSYQIPFPAAGPTQEFVIGLISKAWEKFKTLQPNTDAEFVQFLCDNYEFEAIADNEIPVLLQ